MKLTLTWSTDRRLDGRESRAARFLSTMSAVVTIVTPIASIVTIFIFHSSIIPATILAVYVCVLTTFLIILLLNQEGRHRREVHYAPALDVLRKAYRCLADASWVVVEGDGSESSFKLNLRDALQFLAQAFSLVTDSTCRTSVKMIYSTVNGTIGRDAEVYTLCRSSESEAPRKPDRARIGENSDFRDILEENTPYFFSNNLPKQLSSGYQNSHWDARMIREGTFPYRSTIVWPISRPRHLQSGMHEPAEEVIGFLCVDTTSIDVFNETYDVAIGLAFAQALHLALHRFRGRRLGPNDPTTNYY